MEDNKRYIVAIEISSSRITGIAATLDDSNEAEEICHYEEAIDGPVIYGEIKNVDAVYTKVNSIIQKIESHKSIAPRKIKSVYVGINARSMHSTTVTIEKEINENIPIDKRLMEMIMRESCAGINTETDKILVAKQGLCEIDGKETADPEGSLGSHISVTTTIITCKQKICNSIKMVFDRLNIGIKDYIPTQLALAKSKFTLTSDERRLGCVLVDFGSDTTAVSIYKKDRLIYLNTLPMGSHNITRDLTTLNMLPEKAEKIKCMYGIMHISDVVNMEIASGVSSTDVVNYISARAGEIIANIINQMNIAGITSDELPGGIITVGRGTKMKGFNEMLERISKMNVRKGGWNNKEEFTDRIGSLAILDTASNTATPEESCMHLPEMPATEEYEEETEPKQKKESKPKPSKKSWWKKIGESINEGIGKTFGEDEDEEEENKN